MKIFISGLVAAISFAYIVLFLVAPIGFTFLDDGLSYVLFAGLTCLCGVVVACTMFVIEKLNTLEEVLKAKGNTNIE